MEIIYLWVDTWCQEEKGEGWVLFLWLELFVESYEWYGIFEAELFKQIFLVSQKKWSIFVVDCALVLKTLTQDTRKLAA